MAYNHFEIDTLRPDPLPWDMRSVCVDVTTSENRWMSGVSWQTSRTTTPGVWDPITGTEYGSATTEKNISDFCAALDSVSVGEPVVLYLPYYCATSGTPDDSEIKLAKDRLDLVTSVGMEKVFWQMAHDHGTEVTPAASSASALVATMQDFAINAMPSLPTKLTFHMPSWVAESYLSAAGRDPAAAEPPLTHRGDSIVIGSGYPNLGVGSHNNEIVASNPVGYLLGDIEINESASFITTDNKRVVLAERSVVIQTDWDRVMFGSITVAP